MSSSNTASTQSEASSSQTTSDFLRSANFSRTEGIAPVPENAVTATDLLMAAYDPAKLHPLADLGDKLDYLLLDDDKTSDLPGSNTAVPSRGWSDDLCYGTGTMYLSGAYKISFKLLFSSFGVFASGLDFSLTLSHLISNISDDPSLVLLLFYIVTCSPCVF